MLIDDVMPRFDASISEHLVVDAPSSVVLATAREMDFMRVHSPLMDAAMFIRGLPAEVGRRMGGGASSPPPPEMRLADMFDDPDGSEGLDGWVVLGEVPGLELVFGAIGKVWQLDIAWRSVSAEDFRDFSEPDYAKIAAGFSVREYGANRTLLSYEARTVGTDPEARRKFLRYWWLVRRFVGVVMRATVRTVRDLAEQEPL